MNDTKYNKALSTHLGFLQYMLLRKDIEINMKSGTKCQIKKQRRKRSTNK